MTWLATKSIYRLIGSGALGLSLLLSACGGDSDEATPTATASADVSTSAATAPPTVPPVTSPTESAVQATPTTPLISASPTVDDPAATPATVVDLTESPATAATIAIATSGATPAVTPAPVGSPPVLEGVTSDNPGDGTGGSGLTDRPDEEQATPAASPVAQLTIEGCEVPDVPNYTGENPDVTLTADVNFRSGPGTDCDTLLEEPLGEGQVVTITGGPVTQAADDSEWVQVEVNGTNGWITTEYLEPAE